MVGGEEAAGKPLDAGGEAWREERRQRGKRWTQGEQHGGRKGGRGETAGRRERGMEGGKQAAGKPLDAVGARGAQEQ